ncbi:hypothetical protein [Kribbella swartbergensis]
MFRAAAPTVQFGLSEAQMMCDTTQRLLALLRLLERAPAQFGALGDDAVLDAWFGPRSPVFPQTSQTEAPAPLPL